MGEGSLFQQAATRFGEAAPPLVITGSDYRFVAHQQILESGVEKAAVIIEPEGKNTAPAILAAACHLALESPQTVMLVMPSDHFIPDAGKFVAIAEEAASHLADMQIVCFGVTPKWPETGYGYIKLPESENIITPVTTFIEKPSLATAEAFLADGGYKWNSGIFMMRVLDLLEIATEMQPQLLHAVQRAVLSSKRDLDFVRLDPAEWSRVEAQSFDYSFMEKASGIGCVAFDGPWSDLGDWQALAREKEADSSGNVLHGSAYQINCSNSILWAEKDELVLAGIGLQNIIAIAMGDAVLVANQEHSQHVKAMVAKLKSTGVPQAEKCERETRPWGWFETLTRTETFHVKILHVDPGERLSLQTHKHRSEHWVVVSGIATVIRGAEEFKLYPNESTYIHVGDRHRLCNDTDCDLKVVEVQTGDYFGEDDIERFEDRYTRGSANDI